MQIVINISKDDFKEICMQARMVEDTGSLFGRIRKSVFHGTPLPKDHGRVIDYGYVVDAIDDWINAGEYNYTNATDYLRKRIRNTPTIIEADEEEL